MASLIDFQFISRQLTIKVTMSAIMNIFQKKISFLIICKNRIKLCFHNKSVQRVGTDLEKSLKLTLVLENSWNLKKKAFCPGIVQEFCEIILENINESLKNIKYNESFRIYGMHKEKCVKITKY